VKIFWCLLKKELRTCFLSPIAFVVIFFFWVLMGGNFVWLLHQLANDAPISMATQLLFGGPFISFSLPIIIPLITMRLFAEERKMGTLEALLTTPLKVVSLVLSKFFGALFFYLVLWLPLFVFALILAKFSPSDEIIFPDWGSLYAGTLGIILVGGFYISVGLLMSSLTSSQIVAAIAGFAVLFCTFLAGAFLAYTTANPTGRVLGQYFSSYAHMFDFARGIVSGHVVVLYLSFMAWFLFATVRVVESKRL